MLSFIDLASETPTRRTELTHIFFDEIYRDAFLDPDLAEGPSVWLPLMGPDRIPGQPRIRLLLACTGAQHVAGGMLFEHYHVSDTWLLTYIAVRPGERHRGIAIGLMQELRRTVGCEDRADCIVLAETEDPMRIRDAGERAEAERRLAILARLGLQRLPVAYVQPALGADKRPVAGLVLLLFAPEGVPTALPALRVAEFLKEFYQACGQSGSLDLVRMCTELGGQDTLQSEDLTAWYRARADRALG